MTQHPIRTLLGLPFSYRQRKLGRERTLLDEAEFVHEITVDGGHHAAAILLWKQLQDWVSADNFTPYPSDNLEHVFGIAEEELDEDLILRIVQELDTVRTWGANVLPELDESATHLSLNITVAPSSPA